ncbi:uncharacterized protein V6R79_004178 [Siganus canaliculatus]
MPHSKPDYYDQHTSFLGDFGFFQILNIVLLSWSIIPIGYMGVIDVFVLDTPEFYCRAATTFTHNTSGILADSCSRYSVNRAPEAPAGLSNHTEQCEDGWVFSTEKYTATIVSEWELVCDNAWKVPFSTSMFFVGAVFGSFICGQLSDRFGRKLVLFPTMAILGVTALIQAASVSWLMFCVLNTLRGFGYASIFSASFLLGSEMLSQSARLSFSLLGHSMGYAVGYTMLPLFAYFIRGWRMLLVPCAIACFLFLPLWWVIPESPRWLLLKGRVEEAELVVRKAAKWNRVAAPEVIFKAAKRLELTQNKTEEDRTYSYWDLIRTTNIRNIIFLGFFIWMFVAMVFYGLALNTSNLNGNIYLNCFFSAAIDMIVSVVSWLVMNRIPRPTLLFSMLMFSGITLLVIQLVSKDMHVMIQVFALMGRMGVSAAYNLIYVFFTELIPTAVRHMGFGVITTASRIGTMICPYVIGMGVYSKILPFIVFGTISIVAAVLSMLLPDTANSKIPDLISQTKPIRGCSCQSGKSEIV